MKYAADFMCKAFNEKYCPGNTIVWGADNKVSLLVSVARVVGNEAVCTIDHDGQKMDINPALVKEKH
jgi:hypothetical protein